jgi:hypothetical protein
LSRERPSLARRLRALLRRLNPNLRAGRVEGFVDGLEGGQIRGWALIPGQPGRRVHVIASCEGRIVAEALADLSRMDLMQDGRGDGRHGFRLRLPAEMLDGGRRRLTVEAVVGAGRERLTRGDVELEPPAAVSAGAARPAESAAAPGRALAGAQGTVALVIWGQDDAAAERTRTSWSAQDWPDVAVRRLGPTDDEGELRAWLGTSHTAIFARAGEAIEPSAARLLVQARPLGEVLTWHGRPEARALGALAGEHLGGAFAVRGHVFRSIDQPWAGIRRLELMLASRRELRWASFSAALSHGDETGAASSPIERADGEGLQGYCWRDSRLVPERTASRISLAVWPTDNDPTGEAIAALLASAPPDAEIEVLVAASAMDVLAQRTAPLGLGDRLSIRPVDPPAGATGRWLRVLSEAATGEAVLIAHAGVRLQPDPHALEDMAAWSLSPLCAAVTAQIMGDAPLAGLKLRRDGAGWAAVSAHDPRRQGQGRPVLAAPAALLCIGRERLAAVGGVDDLRFPGEGADLDLGLRLRRAGWSSLLLGSVRARFEAGPTPPLAGRADLAALDADELAAAEHAFADGP